MTVDVFAGTVDFGQAHVSDTNRHVTTVLAVGNSELAGIHCPGSNLVRAVLIREELNGDAGVLAVGQALGEGVIEAVDRQGGGLRSDGGQSGDELVFHQITRRTGRSVCKTIGDGKLSDIPSDIILPSRISLL